MSNSGWWGGYGIAPVEEVVAQALKEGEKYPQQDLFDEYVACCQNLQTLVRAARDEAGNDTNAAQWNAAWEKYGKNGGIDLWRRKRWCAERIMWA